MKINLFFKSLILSAWLFDFLASDPVRHQLAHSSTESKLKTSACKDPVDINELKPVLKIVTTPSVANAAKLFSQSEQGVSFNTSKARVSLQLTKNQQAQVHSIEISKELSTGSCSVKLRENAEPVDSKQVSFNRKNLVLTNFADKTVDEIVIDVKNSNEKELRNLRVNIKACLGDRNSHVSEKDTQKEKQKEAQKESSAEKKSVLQKNEEKSTNILACLVRGLVSTVRILSAGRDFLNDVFE
jgi:hypothetical protein